MIITKKRIRSLKSNLGNIKPGTKFIVGVSNLNRYDVILKYAGFSENLEIGESVLPRPRGPVSMFNANGKNLVHRDQPMETAYTSLIWEWDQWAGRDQTERKSKLVDRSYKRYPRTFITPPSIELTVAMTSNGNKAIISPLFKYNGNDNDLLHRINLFLEIFGECHLFTENLNEMLIRSPIRLNWNVLPKGRMPWKELENNILPIVNRARKGNRPVIWDRIHTINKYGPDFLAIGKAGFNGYIVFGFEDKNLYIFESIFYGNASYIFDNNWEELSKKSKAEILDQDLQKSRIIHRANWKMKFNQMFNDK
jgi:hypothetical protein